MHYNGKRATRVEWIGIQRINHGTVFAGQKDNFSNEGEREIKSANIGDSPMASKQSESDLIPVIAVFTVRTGSLSSHL